MWNKPAVFAEECLSERLCDLNASVRTETGQYLVKNLRSDLIFSSSRHDKAECLWFYLNPMLSLDFILTVRKEGKT